MEETSRKRSVLGWTAVTGLGWTGLDCDGLAYPRPDWTGRDYTGLGYNMLERRSLGRTGRD